MTRIFSKKIYLLVCWNCKFKGSIVLCCFFLQNPARYRHCIGHKNLQFLMPLFTIKYAYMYAV